VLVLVKTALGKGAPEVPQSPPTFLVEWSARLNEPGDPSALTYPLTFGVWPSSLGLVQNPSLGPKPITQMKCDKSIGLVLSLGSGKTEAE